MKEPRCPISVPAFVSISTLCSSLVKNKCIWSTYFILKGIQLLSIKGSKHAFLQCMRDVPIEQQHYWEGSFLEPAVASDRLTY